MSAGRRVDSGPITQRQGANGPAFVGAFQFNPHGERPQSSQTSPTFTGLHSLSPRRRAAQVAGMNGYNASTDLPPPLYVRALYNYKADDPTSLSFRSGDIIQVLTQLESGWWDGVMDGTRGWFPSNYCAIVDPDDPSETGNPDDSEASVESGTEEEDFDEEYDSDANTQDEDSDFPIEGADAQNQDEAGFWVPQATPDGRLFYFNTRTGVSSMELPLETPPSTTDIMPPSSNNFQLPSQTRPPPEMLTAGYQHEEDYDGSASDLEGERSIPNSKISRLSSSGASGLGKHLSINGMPASSQMHTSFAPNGTTATSFSVPPQGHLTRSGVPKYFSDEAGLPPVTWDTLVENMRSSVEAYCLAIRNGDRAEYVRRAEDISDHLRMLLAAGSGTTDNHSGNPSIISTNKALYPHFREMMSKFSKLVLSSHIAAADWPGPEAGSKCLQEADGVMHGVRGYVEVARQQRGEDIPRLAPGFVAGSGIGGNWQDNNMNTLFVAEGSSFIDGADDDRTTKPSVPLDQMSLRKIEEARLSLVSCIRKLESQLQFSEKLVNPREQAAIGDAICITAAALIEQYRPWISWIESIDLGPVGNVFQKPSLLDFSTHKQKVYDSIGDLITVCQATTAPLPDEWAEVRGDSLDTRINAVRNVCKQLESHVAQATYSLQLLEPAAANGVTSSTSVKKEHRMTDPGDIMQATASRGNNLDRPRLAEIGQSRSYTVGQGLPDPKAGKGRPPTGSKPQQFFGGVPPILTDTQNTDTENVYVPDERPWFLQMDHENELHKDLKVDPPQVKSGTLAGLVEQLTRHDRPDPSFNTTFLLTYRSFISAAELFQFLVKRFNIQPPQGLSRDDLLLWEEQKQKPVRFRVVNILKTWLEHYWMESNDAESKTLLEHMNAFARNTVTNAKIPGGAPLATVIDQRMKGQDMSAKKLVLTLTGNPPPPILPKNVKKLKFLDIDATEFARQLTIAESKLYGRIRPVECLEKIWEKKDSDETSERAPNVRALILHSNQMTNWVAEMILSHNEVRKRTAVIKHFVAIADVSFIPT